MVELTIRERRRYLIEMATNLDLLEFDIQQEARGWKTVRLADFAAIHAFAYGSGVTGSEKSDGVVELLESHRFARQQVALGLIFSGQHSPLGLLPSYASELANHIRRIRADSSLVQHLLSRGRERRTRLGILLDKNTQLQEFLIKHKSGEASVQDAVSLAQRSFPEILAMVRIASGDVLGTLARLLRSKVVDDAKNLLPKHALAEPPQVLIDDWYQEISLQRSNDRQYASMVDALACSYLEAAEPTLLQFQINIQFITPSTIISRLVRDRKTPAGKSSVRSYDYFLLAMAFDGRRDQIPHIKREVDALYSVYEKITRPEEADKWLDGAERIWKEVENLSALRDSEFSGNLMQISRSGKFEQIIYRLAVDASEHPEAFDEQAMAVVTGFQRELELFQNLLPEAKSSIRSFMSVYQRRKQWLTLPSLEDDFPLALRFKAGSIHTYARHLSSLPDEHSRNDFQAAAANISAKVIREASDERYLFAGYLAALAGKHNAAVQMLNTGLATATIDIRVEFLYLLAVIYRYRHEYSQAYATLQAASQINVRDPRLFLELASIDWLRSRQSSERGSPEFRQAITQAIELVQKASDEAKRASQLVAQVLEMRADNALAFLFAELALSSPPSESIALLEKADARITALRTLWPEADWSGRALDTRGWLSYDRAKLLRPEDRRDLLLSAKEDVGRALSSEVLDLRRIC